MDSLVPEGHAQVRTLIANGRYRDAVECYYDKLGDAFYGPLTRELLYLKRLAGVPIAGRDVLFFRAASDLTDTIRGGMAEYVSCLDEVLDSLTTEGQKTPLAIMLELVPTMAELVERRRRRWHDGVVLCDGRITRDSTPITVDSFSTTWDWCPEGTLFPRYPDPIFHCRVLERPVKTQCLGLWTPYAPEFIDTHVRDLGLHVNVLDVYFHRGWGKFVPGTVRQPPFQSIRSMAETSKFDSMFTATTESNETEGIRYTGHEHVIEGVRFYEIDALNRGARTDARVLSSPLAESLQKVLRQAENTLRERYGLPQIGEGWVTEALLYRLVQTHFPDAVHHASPEWLKPQHLDIYIPSLGIAIEYQGKQHFEAIDFFGGEKALLCTAERDRRKIKRCQANGVRLLHWRYDEPIEERDLLGRLRVDSNINHKT